ncbi:MAG: ATP-binding cassette domain-containing protein [Ferruginibacter sp.]
MLQVKNISTGYGKKQVLFDVSLEVKQGEIVLLIGSNGSGKSTLLKAIYNLLPPFHGDGGQVFFDNEIITGKLASDLIKKGLLYIPQKNICFDNLTVLENLAVAGISLNSNKTLKEQTKATMQHFPILKNLLSQKTSTLSGGEKQIMALAMASLHQPRMILLDEPLTGLSPLNINLVLQNLVLFNKQYGTSFLIVEHRLEPFVSIASKMIGLKLGKLFGQYIVKQKDELKQLHNLFT